MTNFTPQEDITRSGASAKTLATVGDTLIINTNGDNACAFDLSGTFTGANLSFSASWDNQQTWKGVPGTPVTTGAFTAGGTTGIIATPSTWNVIAQGATHVRVTLDALSTGGVQAQGISFYLASPTVVQISGSNGTSPTPILTDTTGRQLVRPQEDPAFAAAVTGALTTASQTVIASMAGFNGFTVALTGTFSGANVSFQASYDGGTTYLGITMRNTSTQSGTPANSVTGASAASTFSGMAPTATHVKATLTSISSGTINIRVCPFFGSDPATIGILPTAIGLFAIATPTTSNGAGGSANLSVSRLISSAATTNATNVKSSGGRVYKINCYNSAATVRYLKLYNKAGSPTVGTDTPVITLALAPLNSFEFNIGDIGYYLATGIAFAITGAAADADTTAIVAGDIVGMNVFYF